MERRYFAVGPSLYENISAEAELIGSAVRWLIEQQNPDGTWGGPDHLDQFITTNHAVMSLFAVGLTHSSDLLKRAVEYLLALDTDKHVSFFWRSGTLLNISTHSSLIKNDMEHMWTFRRRVGVHKDYPVPFFLLKLLRFANPKPSLAFGESDVLNWILEEWDPAQCWYGRSSITTMALALIYDLEFDRKDRIIKRSHEFLAEQYRESSNGEGMYSLTIVSPSTTCVSEGTSSDRVPMCCAARSQVLSQESSTNAEGESIGKAGLRSAGTSVPRSIPRLLRYGHCCRITCCGTNQYFYKSLRM